MTDETQIEKLTKEVRKDLEGRAPQVLQQFPMQPYLDSIRRCPNYDGVCSLLQERGEAIERTYGERTHSGYQRLALLMLMGGSLEIIRTEGFPGEVREFCLDRFRGILAALSGKEGKECNHRNAGFVDDVRWCSLGTLPIGGAWMTEVTNVWKRHLVGGGARQFFSFLFFILFHLGGRGPVYRIHTLKRHAGGFTSEERTRCYLRIAELMRQNRQIKGLYVLGWLYDPKLAEISPELGYLREVPERNGARLFRFGATEAGVRLATAFSPHRKRLYEEGKYRPTDYGLVWPRREMLRWVAAQPNQTGSAA
jgi:hypothetical protein